MLKDSTTIEPGNGCKSYRLQQSGTNGDGEETAAIASTVIVLFREARMSASATSEKRLLLLQLLLLDADR